MSNVECSVRFTRTQSFAFIVRAAIKADAKCFSYKCEGEYRFLRFYKKNYKTLVFT